jgi:hypothetical protein
MAELRLLVDNDLFVLLSGADMLDAALEVLGFQRNQVEILPALPHMLRKRKFKQLATPTILDKVRADCEGLARVQPPAINLLDRLNACNDIDPGEAVLFGRLVESSIYLLASGDKRAMIAFASTPDISDLRSSVAGRVACLEIVLERLVLRLGVTRVAEAFRAFPEQKSLQVFFSPKNSVDQEACLAALDSYLRDLKRYVGNDLLLQS